MIGEDPSCADSRRSLSGALQNWDPRYYFDEGLGVVLSVPVEECEPGRIYYLDPGLRDRACPG